ncbi:hypothetical protein PC129_g9296 [Phytophthora cactorum]|uniref:Uncharacterized protein n=1 Tax=Phytophthora cactorum TaxID=29920 RepID=A0A8T1I6D4_9STRA|nr:hypothetical protein PC129_g9296 [Phytophthora cactorum]
MKAQSQTLNSGVRTAEFPRDTSISLDLVIFQGPWSFSTDAAEGAMKSDISGRLKSHLPTQRQRTPICN